MRTGGGRTGPIKYNPQGLTGVLPTLREAKGGDRTGDETKETGLWHRDAGADKDLGRKYRVEIQ